jgi:hypothetical protein
MSIPSPPRPLALTDQQLDAIHRAAWPLGPHDRVPFLEAVAEALAGEPTLGDGVVYRVAVQAQRRFWTPRYPLEGALLQPKCEVGCNPWLCWRRSQPRRRASNELLRFGR